MTFLNTSGTYFDRVRFSLSLFGGLLMTCTQVQAERPVYSIDDRCEVRKAHIDFDRRANRACDIELESCIENRMSQFDEPEDQAQNYCWYRPSTLDSRFVGRCPSTLAALEAKSDNDSESLMRLISIRNVFNIRNEVDYPIDAFKREESLRTIRNILAVNPDNPIALTLFRWTLSYTDDEVQYLNLNLHIHELDPDCPEFLWLFPSSTFGKTNVIVDNWLASDGSGSELTEEEIKDLLLRVQRNLLSAYDQLIEQSEGRQKLHWALDSVHNSILARGFENFQQIAARIAIGLDDHVEKRSASLIQRLSREYDIDSDHGRTRSLNTVCSNHAFELGLLDHCLKLFSHFGIEDSQSLESPADDWTRAGISLMTALTRDCSQEHPLEFLFVPTWWYDRQCFEERHLAISSNIEELLVRFPQSNANAPQEVLEAYLRLDKTSDERLLRALDRDSSLVIYAAPLSQRLHRLGLVDDALNILENIDDMSDQLTSDERDFLNHVSDSVKDGIYQNWDESGVDFQGTASPG